MQNIIKIHPLDNVAVALQDLAADERIESGEFSVKLAQPVVRGHKFALTAIELGQMIVKYGLPIGHALTLIQPGEHIHSQNAKLI